MTPSGMVGGQPVRKAARLLRLPGHGAYAAPITAEVTIREATPEDAKRCGPILYADLFRWCLSEGLRVVKPMSLMATGEYHEPQGAWYPSVIY